MKNPISYDRRGKAEEKRRGYVTVWDKPYLSVLESGSGCHYSCLCGTSIQCHLYQPFIILSTPSYRFCPHSQVHITCRTHKVFLSGSFSTQLSTDHSLCSLYPGITSPKSTSQLLSVQNGFCLFFTYEVSSPQKPGPCQDLR